MDEVPNQRIEISESTITRIASMLTALTPIVLGIFQYVNDPSNLVGILICALLFVVLVLWRMTQQSVRELKAEIVLLRNMIEMERGIHARYKEISNATIVNMFAQINRLAGDRDAGSITLDKETGASMYVPPIRVVFEGRRATD